MRSMIITASALLLAGSVVAFGGTDDGLKVSLHVLPHGTASCETGLPVIADCADIQTTYDDCEAFDVFPVFYGLAEAMRIEYGLTWPAEWGDCVFTACAGDHVTGDIVSPGDGVTHEWNECHVAWSIVTGYASFDAVSFTGTIALAGNPQTGIVTLTDCGGGRHFPIGTAAAGVCGVAGEDPCACGCPINSSTWSAIKSLF